MVSERLRSSLVTDAVERENDGTNTFSKASTMPRKAPRADVLGTAQAVVVVVAAATEFLPPTAWTTTKERGRDGQTLRTNPNGDMMPPAG